MLKRNVKRLPVLRGDAVVGIISRSDLLKGLLASLPKAGRPSRGRGDQGRHPGRARQARLGAARERARRRRERRRHLRRRDHRRTHALGPEGNRREHAGRNRRPRPHVLDRAELRILPAVRAGGSVVADPSPATSLSRLPRRLRTCILPALAQRGRPARSVRGRARTSATQVHHDRGTAPAGVRAGRRTTAGRAGRGVPRRVDEFHRRCDGRLGRARLAHQADRWTVLPRRGADLRLRRGRQSGADRRLRRESSRATCLSRRRAALPAPP